MFSTFGSSLANTLYSRTESCWAQWGRRIFLLLLFLLLLLRLFFFFFFFFYLFYVSFFIKIRRSQVSEIKILWKHRTNRKQEKIWLVLIESVLEECCHSQHPSHTSASLSWTLFSRKFSMLEEHPCLLFIPSPLITKKFEIRFVKVRSRLAAHTHHPPPPSPPPRSPPARPPPSFQRTTKHTSTAKHC